MTTLEESINANFRNLNSDSELDECGILKSHFDYSNDTFTVILTTPRLMTVLDAAEFLQTDATYKLTYLGFPLIIVGTSDVSRHFHPVCFAFSSNEASENFKMTFEALITAKQNFRPNALLADCAAAITKAFFDVFGETKRIYCWFHVYKAMKKRMNELIKCDGTKLQLCNGINVIQRSCNSELFARTCELFLAKW